jgi:tRNA 2-thiocytidine biosynthesis protein TtcA
MTKEPARSPVPKFSRTYQILNRTLGQALHAYEMIADGDRLAVGLSGGKDSWALLWMLAERLPRVPVSYKLLPIHIDPGFGGETASAVETYCRSMGWSVHVEHTDYGVVAHSPVNRENPCFLCARLRRKRLFELAAQNGCNKLVLGHHKDDLIETFLMNLFYGGDIGTMQPRQPFFNGKLTVIRPLAYTDENVLARFAREMRWPVTDNPCPSAGQSKRAEIKTMLQTLYKGNKKVRGNMFRAVRRTLNDSHRKC